MARDAEVTALGAIEAAFELSGLKLRGKRTCVYPALCACLTDVANGLVSFSWRIFTTVVTPPTRKPPYRQPADSISPYSAVKRYNARGDTTLHDAPPLRSAGRISSGAARRYHLVAETPLDLGAMLTADRP